MSTTKGGVLHLVFGALVLSTLYLRCFPLSAGTVISSNLPPNTAIINISGTADGAAAFNGDQSLWLQPFNISGPSYLLEYTALKSCSSDLDSDLRYAV